MKVANGVEMLELSAATMSGSGNLYPALIWDQSDAVLVDAGLPGMAPLFINAIKQAGVALEKIAKVIITHHDLDHLGSLRDLQQSLPSQLEVLAHTDEVPYIQGEKIPTKLTPKMLEKMKELMKDMPEANRKAMQGMGEIIAKQKLKVARTVGDGEELPYCGGIQIIHTPGHTPGHICLYLNESKTLIAGDLLFVEKGNLSPAPSFINADTSMAMASIEKISGYDIDNVIAYHGGLFRDNPNQRLNEIIQGNRTEA